MEIQNMVQVIQYHLILISHMFQFQVLQLKMITMTLSKEQHLQHQQKKEF